MQDLDEPALDSTEIGLEERASRRDSAAATLLCLAVGTFAIGTEGFMIAGLLPRIAADLAVSLVAAGHLVTVFALAYAVGSPVLTVLTGGTSRQRGLAISLGAFAGANLLASIAPTFAALVIARIVLACTAGLYVPSASAFGAALVGPEIRGQALAVVNGGFTMALALGVPLSTLLGSVSSWRMTFVLVAGLAAVATLGLAAQFRRWQVNASIATTPAASLRERIAVARRPGVLRALGVTLLWAMSCWSVYTYIAVFLAAAAGIQGRALAGVLLLCGVAAAVGVSVGGWANDRHGSRSVLASSLAVMALALAGMSLSARMLHGAIAPLLVATAAWSIPFGRSILRSRRDSSDWGDPRSDPSRFPRTHRPSTRAARSAPLSGPSLFSSLRRLSSAGVGACGALAALAPLLQPSARAT